MRTAAQLMRSNNVAYNHKVVFRVVCDSTELGQTVVVTGDSSRLGSWNPLQGVYLMTNVHDFPIWRSEPVPVEQLLIGLSASPCLEYKYVIVDQSKLNGDVGTKDVTSVWEDGFHGNRKVMLTIDQAKTSGDTGLIKLRDTFNRYEQG